MAEYEKTIAQMIGGCHEGWAQACLRLLTHGEGFEGGLSACVRLRPLLDHKVLQGETRASQNVSLGASWKHTRACPLALSVLTSKATLEPGLPTSWGKRFGSVPRMFGGVFARGRD